MEMEVLKSFIINGNLQDGKLLYKPYPSDEFSTLKYISISSVAYQVKSEVPIQNVCSISCNFVKAKRFDKDFKVVSYEQPMQSFLINNSKTLQLTRYNFAWFRFNSISEELIFSFRDFKNKLFTSNTDISLTVYLR